MFRPLRPRSGKLHYIDTLLTCYYSPTSVIAYKILELISYVLFIVSIMDVIHKILG
jgi:hypothetical protein